MFKQRPWPATSVGAGLLVCELRACSPFGSFHTQKVSVSVFVIG